MAELKILTYNVQSLGGISKRTDIFDLLKNLDFDIYCLQEAHFTDTERHLIKIYGMVNAFLVTTHQMPEVWQFCLVKTLNIKFINI